MPEDSPSTVRQAGGQFLPYIICLYARIIGYINYNLALLYRVSKRSYYIVGLAAWVGLSPHHVHVLVQCT